MDPPFGPPPSFRPSTHRQSAVHAHQHQHQHHQQHHQLHEHHVDPLAALLQSPTATHCQPSAPSNPLPPQIVPNAPLHQSHFATTTTAAAHATSGGWLAVPNTHGPAAGAHTSPTRHPDRSVPTSPSPQLPTAALTETATVDPTLVRATVAAVMAAAAALHDASTAGTTPVALSPAAPGFLHQSPSAQAADLFPCGAGGSSNGAPLAPTSPHAFQEVDPNLVTAVAAMADAAISAAAAVLPPNYNAPPPDSTVCMQTAIQAANSLAAGNSGPAAPAAGSAAFGSKHRRGKSWAAAAAGGNAASTPAWYTPPGTPPSLSFHDPPAYAPTGAHLQLPLQPIQPNLQPQGMFGGTLTKSPSQNGTPLSTQWPCPPSDAPAPVSSNRRLLDNISASHLPDPNAKTSAAAAPFWPPQQHQNAPSVPSLHLPPTMTAAAVTAAAPHPTTAMDVLLHPPLAPPRRASSGTSHAAPHAGSHGGNTSPLVMSPMEAAVNQALALLLPPAAVPVTRESSGHASLNESVAAALSPLFTLPPIQGESSLLSPSASAPGTPGTGRQWRRNSVAAFAAGGFTGDRALVHTVRVPGSASRPPSPEVGSAAGSSNAATEPAPPTRRKKVFQCDVCQKTFTRAFNLKSHAKTHTNDRPHKCQFCDRTFARKHDCERHERIHSGAKPYECTVCKRGFARHDALSRHLRVEVECGSKVGKMPRRPAGHASAAALAAAARSESHDDADDTTTGLSGDDMTSMNGENEDEDDDEDRTSMGDASDEDDEDDDGSIMHE
ncbi:hypothetical protein GGF31_000730 [Allomyces arbusculus]|nr:hypothetical protein GGF31_000730 [Allomyces arbusculus]